ncbi:amino acid ABC transporter permease protein YxeN [Gottschalkia acidurici 9a]|uniref:Amino acid ABC transporter permease protein YxeN n=1 Tax=Gottschalkia acidurici (strain ATCC 7906 / DSM 604 / BCRC 14475 / CIP 104303 / KCTC 5404 / NCIMB 10678 / 9a) TaxID=1128398 RepID=K0B306_GOTA9|nr:amino acid ABC transporter permease [Gottschalkia acidurici]AFS79562.1 amino acid ABC transporter permease protein YxeN [Gottschalkia acidurici 9a]
MKFDFEFAFKLIFIMMKYVKVTLALSVSAMTIGLVSAIIITLIIDARVPFLRKFFKIYISFFRGTPLIAQLFLLYFGLAQVIPAVTKLQPFNAALIIMGMNSAAYMAEVLRGSISSVDKGQMEASLSIGMNYVQAMTRIVFPQAFKIAIPALSNTFINLIKDSSIAFTIGVTEITASAQLEATSSFKYLEAYVNIILIYWVLTSVLGYFQRKLELKLDKER